MIKYLKLKNTKFIKIALIVLGIGVVGFLALMFTKAATPVANLEAESATRTGNATVVNDATASGGKALQFNAASTSPPPSSGINCAPKPSACGYPDATNTGIPAGTVLKKVPQDITVPDASTGKGWRYDSRGWITVDTDGAIIQNIDTSLNIDVTASNVIVQRVRIKTGGEGFGVSVRRGKNVTIQDSEISGTNSGNGRLMVGIKDIYGDTSELKVLRNNIYYVSTGVQMDSGLIQDNYIHDMGLINGDHINGTTSNSGTTLLTIKHNTSFNQFSQTDAISLFEDFGVQANRVIDNNLVAGGGYCIYGGQNSGGPATYNIKITNNRFSRLYYPGCGSYGPIAAWNANGSGNVWSGNVWDDTNAVLNP